MPQVFTSMPSIGISICLAPTNKWWKKNLTKLILRTACNTRIINEPQLQVMGKVWNPPPTSIIVWFANHILQFSTCILRFCSTHRAIDLFWCYLFVLVRQIARTQNICMIRPQNVQFNAPKNQFTLSTSFTSNKFCWKVRCLNKCGDLSVESLLRWVVELYGLLESY